MTDIPAQYQVMSLGFEVQRLRQIREALEADNIFLRGVVEQLSAKNLEQESRLMNFEQAESAEQGAGNASADPAH